MEKWKSCIEKDVCIVIVILPYIFHTINDGLLLAKPKAYGFSNNAVQLTNGYLKS